MAVQICLRAGFSFTPGNVDSHQTPAARTRGEHTMLLFSTVIFRPTGQTVDGSQASGMRGDAGVERGSAGGCWRPGERQGKAGGFGCTTKVR